MVRFKPHSVGTGVEGDPEGRAANAHPNTTDRSTVTGTAGLQIRSVRR